MPLASTENVGTIVLIEDDASLRDCLGEFLQDHGFTTHVASTLRKGWELVCTVKPQLCLLDLNLPDGSGLDLLRTLVRNRLQTRVIVLTALPLQHVRPRYPEHTLAAWLAKPVLPQQLLMVVKEVLAGCDAAGAGT